MRFLLEVNLQCVFDPAQTEILDKAASCCARVPTGS